MLGAAVVNGSAYFSGGLDANDPTYPLTGSELEVVDLDTLSPRVLQTAPDEALGTARYRQQMAFWRGDQLVMVGGQQDNRCRGRGSSSSGGAWRRMATARAPLNPRTALQPARAHRQPVEDASAAGEPNLPPPAWGPQPTCTPGPGGMTRCPQQERREPQEHGHDRAGPALSRVAAAAQVLADQQR